MTPVATAIYWEWVKSEATLIDTDGCSKVLNFHLECCLEHDLGYYYGKDPRDAYRLWVKGDPDYWKNAADITREEADRRFRKCHQVRSKLGWWSWVAFWRWRGVRRGGQGAWDKHRERERRLGVRRADIRRYVAPPEGSI